MRALAEERIGLEDPGVAPALDRCLACRACESACPSGVRYGELLEDTRTAIGNAKARTTKRRALGAWLDRFVASPRGHRASLVALDITQRLRLDRVAKYLPMPRSMRQSLRLMPKLPRPSLRRKIRPGVYEPDGAVRADVGLFAGCMMETIFGRVNRAVLRILLANGCRVHVPGDQGCCGALHLHAGYRDRARPLVDANLAAFSAERNGGVELDAIILDSAGCGSAMKEYGHWHEGASQFASKVRDLSEFLESLGPVEPKRELPYSVCYDDACHLCHGQGIRSAPRQLLAGIPGLVVRELARPEDCCGSAGIYNLLQPDLAETVLERKIDDIVASCADVCVTANPGCMLQIAMGLRERESPIRVLHLAEVLDEAYGSPTSINR